MFPMKQEWRVN
jgi:hypothetical protein